MQAKGRMARLALALALAYGVVLTGAVAAAPSAPAQAAAAMRLELTPARAVAQFKEPIQYTAEGVDRRGGRSDLTAQTTFTFEDANGDPAPCSEAVEPDKAGQVTCDKPGLFFVTGDVDLPRFTSDRVELEVVLEPVPPGIESVDPKLTPPGRNVTVTGTTGTCSSTGDLRLKGAKSSVRVAGKFKAKVPIPPGTFPGDDHKLLLRVLCGKDPQKVGVGIVVQNKPPTPVDDHPHTLPGEKVAIPVTDNDEDPDDPDGYDTEVREVTPGPSRGRIAVDGKRIVYTPGKEFDRRGDQFDYAYCDVTGNDGQRACGTATVFVARTLPEPKDDPGITTERNVEVVIPVTANDKFPDNDALHVSRPPKVPGAEAVVDSKHPGSITYKPAKDVTGGDTFEYDYCPAVIGVAASSTCASATVSVTVVERQVDPGIDSVKSDPSPPNRAVVVKGTTGTCDKAAKLTLNSAPTAATPVPVTGRRDGGFEAKLEIPAGTFVGPYVLKLHAVCSGTEKAVERGLTVENTPPDAANDQAVIDATAGQPTNLPVLRNDRDPDDPDGYETRVTVERGPAHGTAVARDDGTIDYTPGGKFVDVGQDQFTYRSCEVVGADGQTDCDPDTATVTVTKKPPEAVDDPGIVTVQGEPIAIKVMANDRNAGELDIPKLRVRPDPAPQGEARPQADGTIEYRPGAASTGEDSFQYDYCGGPNVINAAQDCRPATVTVDVRPLPQITSVTPNPTPPNREVAVTGTTGPCREGTLTLRIPQPGRDDVKVAVTAGQDGRFEAPLKVPGGTFVGTYTLELRVDCGGRERVAQATLEVRNRPPDAVDDRARTDQNTPVIIDVTGNDTDPDGDDGYKTSLEAAKPANGKTDVLSNDRVRYTPNQGFAGVDPFTYTLCETVDANGGTDCDTATVTVTVIGGRDPVPVDDPDATTLRDQPVSILVTANDVKPDPAKLEVRNGPKDGTAVVQEQPRDGHILYTPPAGFTGTASFTYDYCRSTVDVNARAACRFATVTVDVTEPPTPPTIETVAPNPTPPNREVEVTGTTGSCSQAGRLILHIPSPGSDVAVPVTGAFTERLKVPGGTFVGDYRLELRVDCQGKPQADEETLEVANKAPDAVDDLASTTEGTPVTIPVTDNDTDPDGDDGYQTTLEATQPPNGATEVQPDNRVLYTPNARASGEDRFTYTLCDIVDGAGRKECDTATVTVAVATGPLISSVEPASTPPGKPVKVSGNTGTCGRAGTLALQGTSATATVTGDQGGAFTASLTVPAGTFPKPYRLELRVDCQGQPQRAEAQLTVTNKAPVAADDVARTARDQAKEIRVTDNDRDPDDPDGYRTRVLVTKPPDHGTAEPQPDLTVVYTPRPGFVGRDRFTYRLCDDVLNAAEQADCGAAATVTVTVTETPTPVAPVISSVDPGSTSPGKPVEVAGNTGSCGRAGTLTLSGAAGLRMGVAGDQDGRFAVTVTVPDGTFPGPYKLALDVDCKGQVQRAEADLTVTNQAPVAADDQATTTPDTATTIEVTGNDRDPDDPDTYPTIVVVTSPPDQGTAEARPDLSIVYTPGPGFVGTDRFTYSLCDDVLNATGQADCGTATVTVRVDPIACASSAGDISSLRVEPGRGQGGTRVRITAAVDTRLATCQLRLLLGGTPLAPDVTVGDDGSISAERAVPPGLKTGRNPMQLATMTAATLAETPFEVLGSPPPPRPLLPPWLVRLLLSAGVVAAGFLARAAFGKWGKSAEDRDKQRGRSVERPDDLRAEPHTSPVEVAVEPVPDNTRTLAVRLEPHPDPGIQTVQTLKEVTP